MENSDRGKSSYWNVVKGIGIFCIAVGHCWLRFQNFVYLFHVPLFFFISGYMYNEDKYGDTPWKNIKKRFQNNWMKYICIYAIFILLHNVFLKFHMLTEYDYAYGVGTVLQQIVLVILGGGNELLCSTLWFVPVLVLGSSLFGLLVFVSRKFIKDKFIFQGFIVGILSLMGYWMIRHGILVHAHLQIVLTVQLYFWGGYLLRYYGQEIKSILNWKIALIIFAILAFYSRNHLYSLVDSRVSLWMYLFAFLGIYICLVLAWYVNTKTNLLKRVCTGMGQASFWIMAFHYVIIRTIDRVYAEITDTQDQMYVVLLGAHEPLVPIYLCLGIGIPCMVYCFAKKMRLKNESVSNG